MTGRQRAIVTMAAAATIAGLLAGYVARDAAGQTKQPTPTTDRRPLPPAPPLIYGRASAYGPGLWGNRTA